jgi:hypothetical protein
VGKRGLFGGTVFLGAFLLFLVEPMAAKGLLPILGGSSAVWITCLVFFQAMLLLGYGYAHWLTAGLRWARSFYLGVLGLGVLALAGMLWRPSVGIRGAALHPVWTVFWMLGVSIGLPFLLLGATSPLLQVWLARLDGRGVRYRLFALSNVGSLLGLVAYPVLIEPHVTLRGQHVGWAAGFVAYAGMVGWLGWNEGVWGGESVAGHHTATGSEALHLSSGAPAHLRHGEALPKVGHPTLESTDAYDSATRSGRRVKAMWFLLPMGAAVQLAAVTSHLTVNIAAIPLLWMLPLAAYLVSFIVAFERPEWYRRGLVVRLLVVMLAGLGYALTRTEMSLPISVGVPFFLVELFAACLFCHAEVYRLRPRGAREATEFYLMVGAGTFLVGILSPMVFRANYDLALSFLVTAVLALVVTWEDGWGQRMLWGFGSGLLMVLVVMLHIAYGRKVLEVDRNFYGTLRVTEGAGPAGPVRTLANGTIQHGTQLVWQPGLETIPTTYYAHDSGVGLAIDGCCVGRGRNVGVIGLGVGTLAAYGRAGDRMRFYEINPLVRPIAMRWFTYLRATPAKVTITEGDGRATLAEESPQGFDVLVVDAFSGDAIPLHLLTVEAMALYRRHLAPGGVVAFHVSNQFLNLAPEIGALARASGMEARLFDSGEEQAKGEFRASWVLVSGTPGYFEQGEMVRGTRIPAQAGLKAWTDDYSSLLPVVVWAGK